MSPRRTATALAVLTAALAGFPGTASAHGIGSAAGKTPWEFVPLGVEHMLLGWDHLLFIAGVVLLAGELRRAAGLVSVFVLGHSTTLVVGTLAGWRVDAVAVDVVIALSVLFVGVVAILGRPEHRRWFTLAVLGFGLVHGLGLSTRLQDLGLPENGLLVRVVAFNVGIEIGQLAAIAVLVLLGRVFARFVTWPGAPRAAGVLLAAAGLVTAVALPFVATSPPALADRDAVRSCTTGPNEETYRLGDGGHPPKDFYEPTETYPEPDFAHVLGDGYVLVHYPSGLAGGDLDALRAHVTGPDGNRVVAGAEPGQTQLLKAVHAYGTLTCDAFDLDALKAFTGSWFDDPRSKPVDQ
ncbi:HupE/UreJ family protein [Saccharothrix sp. Mg75]|uniref:HupE/UreJ family protein n=1 Tax=Saccharothrix sp. Mg75 TaxID=3445357 RepID=UPI003EEEB217